MSITSHSADTQSSSSMSVSEEMESPDSVVRHTRRESSGRSWGSKGLSPLKSVFSRTKLVCEKIRGEGDGWNLACEKKVPINLLYYKICN